MTDTCRKSIMADVTLSTHTLPSVRAQGVCSECITQSLSGGVHVNDIGVRSSREALCPETVSALDLKDIKASMMAGKLTEMATLDCNFPKTIPEYWAECERLGFAPALFDWCGAFPELTQKQARAKEYAFMADFPWYFERRHTDADVAYKANSRQKVGRTPPLCKSPPPKPCFNVSGTWFTRDELSGPTFDAFLDKLPPVKFFAYPGDWRMYEVVD